MTVSNPSDAPDGNQWLEASNVVEVKLLDGEVREARCVYLEGRPLYTFNVAPSIDIDDLHEAEEVGIVAWRPLPASRDKGLN